MCTADSSLELINILIWNNEQIKTNEIKKSLYYYKILKDESINLDVKLYNERFIDYKCNQDYIDELTNYIFNGMIYLVSLEDFNLTKYIGSRLKNEFISLETEALSVMEYYITDYFDSNDTLLYNLLDLEEFKYNKDTDSYNYTIQQKRKFKSFKKTLETVLYKAFDTYIINFHY